MNRIALALVLLATLLPLAEARTSSSHSTSSRTTRAAPRTVKPKARSAPRSTVKCALCARDGGGRIARSSTAKHEFQKSYPCPSTGKSTGACKGYVIDHVTPLKRGGADTPDNMAWQTTAAAKAKDKVE